MYGCISFQDTSTHQVFLSNKMKVYLAIIWFSLFLDIIFATSTDQPGSLKKSDDPMDFQTPFQPTKKRKAWTDKVNLSGTESDDSIRDPSRKHVFGDFQYHNGMRIHYQRKGAFHNGMYEYAPPGREEHFIRKHRKERKSSYKLEKKNERYARGLRLGVYHKGRKEQMHVTKTSPPSPPKSTEEVTALLDDRHIYLKNDKKGPQYLLPQRVTNGERKRRHGEPHRIFNLNQSGKESSSETESESEPEYRKQLKRKYRKLSFKT